MGIEQDDTNTDGSPTDPSGNLWLQGARQPTTLICMAALLLSGILGITSVIPAPIAWALMALCFPARYLLSLLFHGDVER